MKHISVTLLAVVLALCSTLVSAQLAPSATPGPMTCPAPVPSQPAGIGAGPAPNLVNLAGTDFNIGYIRAMYQHHSDTAALATQGIQLASDKNLRDLSGKIRYEKTKQNEKLAMWYSQYTGQILPAVSFDRVEYDLSRLQGFSGRDFDIEYALTMINYLEQARDAAQLGISRLTVPEIRDQAMIVADAAQNEAIALRRWLEISSPPVTSPRS